MKDKQSYTTWRVFYEENESRGRQWGRWRWGRWRWGTAQTLLSRLFQFFCVRFSWLVLKLVVEMEHSGKIWMFCWGIVSRTSWGIGCGLRERSKGRSSIWVMPLGGEAGAGEPMYWDEKTGSRRMERGKHRNLSGTHQNWDASNTSSG